MLGWILLIFYLVVAALPFKLKRLGLAGRIVWAVVAAIIFAGLRAGVQISTEALWFTDLGYNQRYWNILVPEIGIFAVSFVIAFGFIMANFLYIFKTTRPHIFFKVMATFACLFFASLFSLGMTSTVYEYLRFTYQVPFNLVEPIFNKDIGFYIFTLPFLKTMRSALFTIVIAAIIGSLVLYGPTSRESLQALSWRRGVRVIGTDAHHRIITHLSALGIVLIGIFMFWTQIAKWDLMYSPRGAVFGPGWTDVHVQIGAYDFFMVALFVSAILLGISVISNEFKRTAQAATLGLLICLLSWIIGVEGVPLLLQSYKVAPNELSMESEYIKYNIKFTKFAYGLTDDKVKQVEFPVNFMGMTPDIISKNKVTFDNVRVWDWRVLQSNNSQYQGFRLYYTFPTVNVVRYIINGRLQQLMYSARELDTEKLAVQSKTWQNQHLVYTHGYGAVANPVNKVMPEGSPDYWIKDIPPVSKYPELQITQPRIYFGEETKEHVYVHTAHQEFDYPLGDANATYRYEAESGIRLDSFLKKLVFALRLDGLRLLTASEITSQTRLLWRRDIETRVKTLAPFLKYDSDKYQVVAKGNLYYIWDAYTTSADFPYSEPSRGRGSLNYIRNSVKVVMNAFTGKVDFYVFDQDDPIIKTYRQMFPGMFKSAVDMPKELRDHVRYPEDLLRIQGDIFSTYHMSDPGVFYNREDAWQPSGELSHGQVEPIMPYYVVMTIPGETKEEFALILPFSPLTTNQAQPRNNMVSWIAARCDGENYGKLLLFKFPKDRLVYGPLQISARMNQDEVISKDFTLWNQQGSQVVLGNLIIIPLADYKLLYVQPVYLQATVGKMPELKRVVVSLGENLGYGSSFEDALSKLTGRQVSTEAPPGTKTEAKATNPELIKKAARALVDYQALQGAGRFAEAGRKLEELKELLKVLVRE
ncbi:MAG: UPF0182 family protein [Dissulfurispiraceae bacterium]|jgi:uncharacterized protein